MKQGFLGYHSEWNLGSPGGWYYQMLAQEIGKLAWKRINEEIDIDIKLDFDDPILNPVWNFAQLLLRAHQAKFPTEQPFIALIAEEETLDKVGENIRFVEYLNTLPGVRAVLTSPSKLKLKKNKVYYDNHRITTIFLDFNNKVIVKIKRDCDVKPLLRAIEEGIVVNPRGMEPIGSKGVFEAVTSEYKDILSETTVSRTPWTRQFFSRSTTGPDNEDISDLVEWVEKNWSSVILKPVGGYSGHGIIIGYKEQNKKQAIQTALEAGDYIVQPLIPLDLWAEEFPWVDRERKQLLIKNWQTDFRCFITDVGLIGFVTRFGGIPTNVGSGGGIQSTAILRSSVSVKEAINKINQAILELGYKWCLRLEQELDKKSVEIGSVYLLGPIKNTLRPRIITQDHIEQLKEYARNLWHDALTLEKIWIDGGLKEFVKTTPEEEAIARLAPWRGSPALIASDGLFNFVKDKPTF